MCYEFVHSCQSPLTNKLAALIPANSYFLVCIDNINYLHCNNATVNADIKSIFKREQIKLHAIPAGEMMSVIDFPGMQACQTFHGSSILLNGLRKKYGGVKEPGAHAIQLP